MSKVARKLLAGVAATGVCLSMFTGMAFAEEDKPTANFSTDILSQYVWRGFAFSKDSIVIQPSMTVGYKGFSANIWGNLDSDPYSADPAIDKKNNWTETDLTLSYEKAYGPATFTAGYIYYGLDAVNDSQEVFLKASFATLLKPTLTVYREIASYSGWYATLGISHSVPLSGEINLDLGAQIGYLRANEASTMAEVDGTGAAPDPNKAYRGMHDGVISAAVPIPLNKYITVTPKLNYSFALSDKASDRLKESNRVAIDKRDDNFIYGGVALSMAF